MLPRRVSVLMAVVFLLCPSALWTAAEERWTLTLFLSPGCPYNEEALRNVAAFLRRHPDVQGSDVLIASLGELTDVLPHAQTLVGHGLAFAVDAAAGDAHGITATPATVLQNGEQQVCLLGQPDLERVWEYLREENRCVRCAS